MIVELTAVQKRRLLRLCVEEVADLQRTVGVCERYLAGIEDDDKGRASFTRHTQQMRARMDVMAGCVDALNAARRR